MGAALLGPAVAAYTAALVADTAVPAWHDGHREMPFVFVGSGAAAAGGLAAVLTPVGEAGPARRALCSAARSNSSPPSVMERRMGLSAEPLHQAGPAA